MTLSISSAQPARERQKKREEKKKQKLSPRERLKGQSGHFTTVGVGFGKVKEGCIGLSKKTRHGIYTLVSGSIIENRQKTNFPFLSYCQYLLALFSFPFRLNRSYLFISRTQDIANALIDDPCDRQSCPLYSLLS